MTILRLTKFEREQVAPISRVLGTLLSAFIMLVETGIRHALDTVSINSDDASPTFRDSSEKLPSNAESRRPPPNLRETPPLLPSNTNLFPNPDKNYLADKSPSSPEKGFEFQAEFPDAPKVIPKSSAYSSGYDDPWAQS